MSYKGGNSWQYGNSTTPVSISQLGRENLKSFSAQKAGGVYSRYENNSAISNSSTTSTSISSSEKKCKLVLLGEASVGKSSLVMRFVNDEFSEAMETTVGAAFFTKSIDVDSKTIRFEIWDTAGQERFATLAPMYYRGAACAIVMYDQTNLHSFERAKVWVEQLQLSANADIVVALAANKCDLQANARVCTREAKKYADENGLTFVETSAKTGYNVNYLFVCIARRLPEKINNYYMNQSTNLHNTVRITADNFSANKETESSNRGRSCCRSS